MRGSSISRLLHTDHPKTGELKTVTVQIISCFCVREHLFTQQVFTERLGQLVLWAWGYSNEPEGQGLCSPGAWSWVCLYVTDYKQANSSLLNNLWAVGKELYFSSAL